jgi:hypothetical protein
VSLLIKGEVARKIAAFHCGMADQEIIAAAHRDGECQRDNHKHDDLLDARAEHDRVGRDQLAVRSLGLEWGVAPCSFRQPRKSAVLRCAAPPSG